MQFIGLPLEMQNDECRMQNYGVGFADDFNITITAQLRFDDLSTDVIAGAAISRPQR